MGEPDNEMVQKTIAMLGQIIKKPVLTDKLLKRPPFKFLHDIIINVIKSTGFMKEAYNSEDMDADNIKDKESKMIFLQKCIEILEIATSEKLDLKPSKVVAGLEANKTNHFLQVLAKAAIENKDNTSAPTKNVQQQKKQQEAQATSGSKKQHEAKSVHGKEDSGDKKSIDRSKTGTKSKDQLPETKSRQVRDAAVVKSSSPTDRKAPSGKKSDTGADSGNNDEAIAAVPTVTTTAPKVIPYQTTDVRATAASASTSATQKETETAITRPTTARAAPPRLTSRKQAADDAAALLAAEQEMHRLASAKPIQNLITEAPSPGAEEDALFLVDKLEGVDNEAGRDIQRREGETGSATKGSLMKHLMETKNELEGETSDESGKEKIQIESQDVEKLRLSLQSLSRSANPLGRILDALQEDMDVMLTELGTWVDEFNRNTSLLQQHKDSIDSEVVSLKTRLDFLDQEIVDQKEKIGMSKAALQRQEEKLRKVIALVVQKKA